MEETEQHITALARCAASLQERFAGRRRTIEVALGFGDESKDAQRVDRQPDLSLRVELTPTHASLEEAFMQVTQDSIEYHAGATR